MSISAYIFTTVAFCSLLGALAGAVKWMVKSYLTELKPNGGSSLKDSVDRLERRVDDLFKLLVDKN